MASGWNLWVWLVSVVVRRYIIDILIIIIMRISIVYSECCCKEVYYRYPHYIVYSECCCKEVYYRYPHNNYDFPYSTCIY